MRNACALFALGVFVFACEGVVNEVRVEPGAAPLKPAFVLTDTSGRGPSGTIYGLSIVSCRSDNVLWQIAATGSNSAPSRIVYGEAPPGFRVNAGPEALRPGCYDVFVTGGRRARFRVDAAGRVTPDPDTRRDTTHR